MEERKRQSYRKRLTGFSAVVILLFLILSFRLWYLQIAKGDFYSELAAGNVMKSVTTSAVRGEIIDCNGVVLAQSIPKFALTLDWTDMTDLQKTNGDWKKVVEDLAGYIQPFWPYPEQSVKLITEDLLVMIRNQQWESYQTVVILEDVPSELQAIIAEHSNELPGVSIEAIAERVYPQKTLLGQVLGYVREISESEIEQFNAQAEVSGDTYEYTQGDLVGKMGVEKSYDTWLRGNHGVELVNIDINARPVDKTIVQEAAPGKTLQLSIDSKLQRVVENELDRVINEIQRKHPDAQAGAAVVIDVKTGKVLAMASHPYMDPNDLTGIISEETTQKYFRSEDMASSNRAIAGLYAPGSTFKMVTAMAALEAGVVKPTDTFADSLSSLGSTEVQKQGVAEWGGNNFGRVNLYSAMAHSSNIYFQIVGRRVFDKNPELIKEIANEFGLGVTSGIDLPYEAEGDAPSPAWKQEQFKSYYDKKHTEKLQEIEDKYTALLAKAKDQDEKDALLTEKENEISLENQDYQNNIYYNVEWRLYDSFNSSIGQGNNYYSIIQMANYVATIVNGGKHYKPYVVDKIIDPVTGEVLLQNEPQVLNEVSVSPETLNEVKKAMSAVTSGEGTAAWLFRDIPEFTGGGKTGTAQIGSKGTSAGDNYNGMFVAFAPYDDPQIAFAGVVEYGGHGSETSGYVAKAAFKQYFGWK